MPSNSSKKQGDLRPSIDLYDYTKLPDPKPRGRPIADDLSDWRVVDDWPDDVPVTPEEVDVFERWFGDLLEEMFGPESGRE
ncbi:hypothetical protein [Rhodophyticola sp.]|jgi:hypothetical protein|uniref:hypothetical protein n=1 Tax=Rhodophyticola sp. TaxID=2680032 RepID=UPI003D2806C7